MAWNPSPDVQVARDAAKALTKSGRFIDRCVILYTTEQGQMGYASYGKDSNHCGQARRLADAVYERAMEALEDLEEKHLGSRPTDGTAIDFGALENEVVLKIRMLKASLGAEMDQHTRTMIVRDLLMPAAELLARFCLCVNVEESKTVPR